jgi:hypothetical protein
VQGAHSSLPNRGKRASNTQIRWGFAGANAINVLFAPFTDTTSAFNRRFTPGTDARIEQALTEFKNYATKNLKLKAEDISSVQQVARANMKMFMAQSEQLKEKWIATLNRYNALIAKAITPANGEMPGINDQPIKLEGRARDQVNGTFVVMNDLRTSITSKTALPNMGEIFALMEFLFTQGLSSSISMVPGNLSGLTLDDCRQSLLNLRGPTQAIKAGFGAATFSLWQNSGIGYDAALKKLGDEAAAITDAALKSKLQTAISNFRSGMPNGVKRTMTFNLPSDQHNIGASPAAFFTTLYFRGLGAGLNELIKNLKSAGIFDKTLIQVAGDFNRKPKKDGSGSDHGFEGSNQSFYSGMIQGGPFVIGSVVKTQTANANYPGCWGLASAVTIRSAKPGIPEVRRPIQHGDIGNSICAVLGITPVSTNGYTIFSLAKSGGQIEFQVSESKET